MKTITINIFKFSELSKASQDRAIQDFMEHGETWRCCDTSKNPTDTKLTYRGFATQAIQNSDLNFTADGEALYSIN